MVGLNSITLEATCRSYIERLLRWLWYAVLENYPAPGYRWAHVYSDPFLTGGIIRGDSLCKAQRVGGVVELEPNKAAAGEETRIHAVSLSGH